MLPRLRGYRVENGRFLAAQFSSSPTIPISIEKLFNQKFFLFNSQRLGIGRCNISEPQHRLQSNASNLPAILNKLQSTNKNAFGLLQQHLREIFPTVHSVSVDVEQGKIYSVLVWPIEEQKATSLYFELELCGTGVAQVIAILTVALTLKNAVIAIDEISAFLHPAAAKALLRILNTHYRNHQYIISAHSTDVITAVEPSTVHLIRRRGFASTVEQLDIDKVRDVKEVARELGVSMSDVFGGDRLIYVEGPTEAECFPFIVSKMIDNVPRGTIFSPVAATGDFKKDRVFHIYESISKGVATLVQAVAFSFDRERHTDEDAKRFKEKSNGKLLLLPRRNFECYLLVPEAISALALKHCPDLSTEASANAIREKLAELGCVEKYGAAGSWSGDLNDPDWLRRVDGAKLLDDVLKACTDQRLTYEKTRDAIELVSYIIENQPEALDELKDYLERLLQIVDTDKNPRKKN